MWIFLNDSYLSIVDPTKDDTKSPNLLVRARFQGDIKRLWSDAEEEHIPFRDYAWRSLIPREQVVAVLKERIEDITYNNFKDSVEENWRHDDYLRVWSVMYNAQERQKELDDYQY